ncbi:MAG: TetR/AcrR family transcriptional regulator [Paludibacteraceae bacterium]|nr:TetR/AcrR family transcriptional regulator [Paludibacteraceae bacterium]
MPNRREETRLHFIETARRLVSQHGRDNVTMNDIATEAGTSRRTIYTYFTNRDEVYYAILEHELTHLLARLEVVMNSKGNAYEKLQNFIFTHMEAIKEAVTHNNSLKKDFSRNMYEVERARRSIDLKEIRMLRTILTEGTEQGTLAVESPNWTALVLFYALKGLEAPFLDNHINAYLTVNRESIVNMLLAGVRKQ